MPFTINAIARRGPGYRPISYYGAVSDGLSDETQALKDAFEDASENGHTIVFPEHVRYRLRDYLFLYGNGSICGNRSWLHVDGHETNFPNLDPQKPIISFGVTALGTSAGLVNTWKGRWENLDIYIDRFVVQQTASAIMALLAAEDFLIDGVLFWVGSSGPNNNPEYPDVFTVVRKPGWINSGTAVPSRGRMRRILVFGTVVSWPGPRPELTKFYIEPTGANHYRSTIRLNQGSAIGPPWYEPHSVNIRSDTQVNGSLYNWRQETHNPYYVFRAVDDPSDGKSVRSVAKAGENPFFNGAVSVRQNSVNGIGVRVKCGGQVRVYYVSGFGDWPDSPTREMTDANLKFTYDVSS